jgi:hypothetical protein
VDIGEADAPTTLRIPISLVRCPSVNGEKPNSPGHELMTRLLIAEISPLFKLSADGQ